MYFASRTQAGRMLATQVAADFLNEKCVVMALTDGGTMVGAQIAKFLKCPVTLLVGSEIMLPREPEAIAGMAPGGVFAYNHSYSQGEIDELVSEFYSYIEGEKITHMHHLNQLVGAGGTISKKLLKDRIILIVSDGLKTGFEVDLAAQFLKPVPTKKIVVAVPFASVQAVDRMHVFADKLYCLSVIADYIDTNHYYDKQDIPSHEAAIKAISEEVAGWK